MELARIGAVGRRKEPKLALLFINPTARNVSSDPAWEGPRYPFIGTLQVWRVFARAGLMPEKYGRLAKEDWTEEFARRTEAELARRGIYITNVVKETKADATLPTSAEIREALPALLEELGEVRPERIVAMGLIPFRALKGESVLLREDAGKEFLAKIVACYFPVGRGNPRRAVEILARLAQKHMK